MRMRLSDGVASFVLRYILYADIGEESYKTF